MEGRIEKSEAGRREMRFRDILSSSHNVLLSSSVSWENQKSRNRERNQETVLTHWWHYLHRWSLQISLSLTNTSTAQLNTYTLSESFTLILTRPPFSFSLFLSLSLSDCLRSKSLHTQRLNPSLSFRPLHSCLDLPVTISCSVFVCARVYVCDQ